MEQSQLLQKQRVTVDGHRVNLAIYRQNEKNFFAVIHLSATDLFILDGKNEQELRSKCLQAISLALTCRPGLRMKGTLHALAA
ncbi:hypothetical protein [uncultured Desulfuromonas sp.]|uniref:hypothetical protein n=1 Tax=uncultured Desulfuromonas sp. TaxID=181013 RepID=UPI002AABD7BE|nr:hypothetical protein [uncultured Desulfuromonas sp.]